MVERICGKWHFNRNRLRKWWMLRVLNRQKSMTCYVWNEVHHKENKWKFFCTTQVILARCHKTYMGDDKNQTRNVMNTHSSCDTHLPFVYIQLVSFLADQTEYGTHNHYWYMQCPNLQIFHHFMMNIRQSIIQWHHHCIFPIFPLASIFAFSEKLLQFFFLMRLLVSLWSPYVIGQTIIFSSCFFLLHLFFPRLISAVGDWMFTILWHMVWP